MSATTSIIALKLNCAVSALHNSGLAGAANFPRDECKSFQPSFIRKKRAKKSLIVTYIFTVMLSEIDALKLSFISNIRSPEAPHHFNEMAIM